MALLSLYGVSDLIVKNANTYFVLFASATYLVVLVFYRLCFSPLANFPGPKLAAATLWYEYYYDVVKRGRYTWKIAELHAQYGALLLGASHGFFKLMRSPKCRPHHSHQSVRIAY